METNYKCINYLNKEVNILQYLSESDTQFAQRLEYITLLEKAKVDWKEAVRLSKIWYCIKFKNCKYNPEIYHKVISYEKKIKT
jgi:hypothetical protein